MAEVHLLSRRVDRLGTEQLATVLERILAAAVDPRPRWPQIRALGGSLRQLTQDLAQMIGCLAVVPGISTPEIKDPRDSLYRLTDTVSRLGRLAETYSP